MLELKRQCICGATMTARYNPTELTVELDRVFDQAHCGPGHAPATAQQAARARRDHDAELRRQYGGPLEED